MKRRVYEVVGNHVMQINNENICGGANLIHEDFLVVMTQSKGLKKK